MAKTILAIYENGVFKPLEKLNLQEAQRLKLTFEVFPSVVEQTQALIQARAEVVREVAESDVYLPEASVHEPA